MHLGRARDKFTGDIKWLRHSCELLLNVDGSCATTAEIAYKTFASMNENQEEWDQKIRAIKFYLRENFKIQCENTDKDTGEKEYFMIWKQ